MTARAGGLPRLFDSLEDLAFEDDADDGAETQPRETGSGIRSFFCRVVAELEAEHTRTRKI